MQEISRKQHTFWKWLQVLRPKTLTAALIPFVDGAFLAHSKGASIRFGLLFSAIAAAIFIQIGTNLINDAEDFERGADDAARLGPQRAIQQGMATQAQVYMGGLVAFALALLCAIPLMIHGGAPLLLLILVSIAAGYCYTAGPFPLAYFGCGELFVLIFFGWVATAAGYWIHTDVVDLPSLVLGTQIGLLGTVLIAINNLRDIAGDRRAGKKTLAVRFGATFARVEISLALYLPFLLGFFWLFNGYLYTATLPWAVFFIVVLLIRRIWSQEPSSAYNLYLGFAALLHLFFGILIGLGLLLD